MPRGALTTYPHKLRSKNFLSPGVHLHPVHLLATPMETARSRSAFHPFGVDK